MPITSEKKAVSANMCVHAAAFLVHWEAKKKKKKFFPINN